MYWLAKRAYDSNSFHGTNNILRDDALSHGSAPATMEYLLLSIEDIAGALYSGWRSLRVWNPFSL